MKYKVLLVDDEPIIREAISESIDWDALGYELVGVCEDGQEALERIKQSPPDLLLTDICMPFVDGMELAKFVYENHFKNTEVIIITGYADFEYAQNALKYHVFDFVLKPVTSVELTDILLKMWEKLDKERKEEISNRKIKKSYTTNLPIIKGRFLNDFLQGKIVKDRISKNLEELNVNLKGNRFFAASVSDDKPASLSNQEESVETELKYFAIHNIAAEIMEFHECGVAFQNMDRHTILIFASSYSDGNEMYVCDEIQRAIKMYLDIECTIGLGRGVSLLQDLPKSYRESKLSIDYKFLLGGNRVIDAETLIINKDHAELNVTNWAEQITAAVKNGDEAEIQKLVLQFIEEIKNTFVSKNRSIFYIQNLILSIMKMLEKSISIQESPFAEAQGILNEIYKKEYLSEVSEELITTFRHVSKNLHVREDSKYQELGMLAMDYIEKNYGDPTVSLNAVCEYLAVSPSYLSNVVKGYTGGTFIEALTKKRIEKAKNLIETTSYKNYQIAHLVGYSDPYYFSKAFKKMTGMSPTEYARKVR